MARPGPIAAAVLAAPVSLAAWAGIITAVVLLGRSL